MEQILTVVLVSAATSMAAGFGLGWARREFAKKRLDYRMGQALRRGIANPDGVRMNAVPVVQWQTCESTSARWS
jgi:hypothetical protein